MTTSDEHNVTEDELHAHVDGQLSAGRRDAVRAYLDADPAEAARIATYAAQRRALRAALAPHAAEALPERLRVRGLPARGGRRVAMWQAAAAVLVAAVAGGAGGWALAGRMRAPDRLAQAMAVLGRQAVASYVVYAVDQRHAVEVGGDDRPHLARWLSNRLNRTVEAPALDALGFHLVGGRLLADDGGRTAALFLYDDGQGRRVGLLLRPMAPDLAHPRADLRASGLDACAWIARGLGYAVTGPLPPDELGRLADAWRAQSHG